MTIEKMGFEKTKYRPGQSYGRSGTLTIDGVDYYCSSEAEARWLEMVTPGLRSGGVVALEWQPEPIPLKYKYAGQECKDTYKCDAHIVFANGDDYWIEIKHGALHQGAANKIKRACQQCQDRAFVLVWYGRIPTKGVVKRRLDRLLPHLHHVWRVPW